MAALGAGTERAKAGDGGRRGAEASALVWRRGREARSRADENVVSWLRCATEGDFQECVTEQGTDGGRLLLAAAHQGRWMNMMKMMAQYTQKHNKDDTQRLEATMAHIQAHIDINGPRP